VLSSSSSHGVLAYTPLHWRRREDNEDIKISTSIYSMEVMFSLEVVIGSVYY
jgi:hypothetical protein